MGILLLGLAVFLPTAFLSDYSAAELLHLKRPGLYIGISVGFIVTVWFLNNLILQERSIFLDALTYPIEIGIILPFLPRGKRCRGLLLRGAITAVQVITLYLICAITFPLLSAAGVDLAGITDPRQPGYLAVSAVVNVCVCLTVWGFKELVQRHVTPGPENRMLLWLLTVPLSQAVLITMLSRLDFTRPGFTGISAGLFFSVALCIASDVACVLAYQKFRQVQLLSDQVSQAEQQLNVQTEYYRRLQENILAVNAIRHDLSNQLTSAYYLLDRGHPEEVRQQLDLLSGCLKERVGARYCENLVVDAVLTEKVRVCREHNIELQLSAPVPADLPIESAHLCSAFSNLLDNSIQGTLASPQPEGPLTLCSDIRDGYLVIRCSNPALPPAPRTSRDPLRVHGLGLDILRQLAAQHQGSLSTEFRDGRFTAVLTLLLQ